MKTRIVKCVTDNLTYYVAQYRHRWIPFMWCDIQTYYQSDFVDMPGWWSAVYSTIEDAQRAVIKWKTGKCGVAKEIVHEK